ncbi:muconate cycloisomerase I [Agaricicola taiwanensis]|uniref:Muconate cycloisomerase I n=1 Tax=Agaricicola taiwanensis TaxID=591372 RepID=A0A8J2YGB5_9RHOB|nr:enolase C-terminal domain-like protein [Agaricicola taiwanensis]GGE37941.1 muconate cycloisomerase I [Agaricicola taiwanensis]
MIERIEIFVTDLPTRVRRIFSSGNYDTGAPGQLLGKPVLVKIHADGIVGMAQIRAISPGHFVPDTTMSVVAAIRDIFGPIMLGQSAFNIGHLSELFDSRLAANPAARAVIDIALHDWVGKALGVPVHTLLGGCCQPVLPLEWSVSLADEPAVMVAEARRAVDEFGIRVLCIKAADRRGWRQDVTNFEAVRTAVGPDVEIGVDPNAGWSVYDSAAAILALGELDVAYIEQPVARRNLEAMAELRRVAAGIPIMADEALMSVEDAYAIARAGAADVFCIKPYKMGGISVARKVAAIAEASDIRLNCGGLAIQSQLEAAAGAHFGASIPLKRTMGGAEFLFGLNTTAPDPLVAETDFVVKNGQVTVPTGPGLGVAIDEERLRHHTLHSEIVQT